jgi:hypothetical protein
LYETNYILKFIIVVKKIYNKKLRLYQSFGKVDSDVVVFSFFLVIVVHSPFSLHSSKEKVPFLMVFSTHPVIEHSLVVVSLGSGIVKFLTHSPKKSSNIVHSSSCCSELEIGTSRTIKIKKRSLEGCIVFLTFTVISSTILNAVDKKFSKKISNQVMKILEDYADTLEQARIDEA